MKEWDNVQAVIHKSTDAKFMIRRWAITLFSALFALSIYQDRETMMLIATATTLLFWLLDAMRQTLQNTAFRRDHEIECVMEQPTDEAVDAFAAPVFGRMFSKRWPSQLDVRTIFGPSRALFFGSMVGLSAGSYLFL